MGLGFFMIFLTICGAGVFAFLFFFCGFYLEKREKGGVYSACPSGRGLRRFGFLADTYTARWTFLLFLTI